VGGINVNLADGAKKRIEYGKASINDFRTAFGLDPLDDEFSNEVFIKVQSESTDETKKALVAAEIISILSKNNCSAQETLEIVEFVEQRVIHQKKVIEAWERKRRQR